MKKQTFTAVSLAALLAASASALGSTSVSTSGYYGNINNGTGYVIECSQVEGGYCANNPMPADGYIQMLPDPGSTEIDGHVMVFDQNKPGAYIDNILFKYSENQSGKWHFSMKSLYGKTNIQVINSYSVLLTRVIS